MKKFGIVFIIISVCVVFFVGYKTIQIPAIPVHYHANFAVFIDGKQADFTSPSLMHIKPCTNDEHESSDPKENVHLHDQVGNVVHVHANGISWQIFFSTIKFNLPEKANEKIMSVYSAGKQVSQGYLDEEIKPQDQLLIHIASKSAVQSISDDPLLQKEEEAVGTNASQYDEGKVGVEKCGVDGTRTLFQRFKLAFHL